MVVGGREHVCLPCESLFLGGVALVAVRELSPCRGPDRPALMQGRERCQCSGGRRPTYVSTMACLQTESGHPSPHHHRTPRGRVRTRVRGLPGHVQSLRIASRQHEGPGPPACLPAARPVRAQVHASSLRALCKLACCAPCVGTRACSPAARPAQDRVKAPAGRSPMAMNGSGRLPATSMTPSKPERPCT